MENLKQAKQLIADAEVVIVTAGNGLAQIEGLDILDKKDFQNNFATVVQKYGVTSVQEALEYKFPSWQEQWLVWSQLIQEYTLNYQPSQAMQDLHNIIGRKRYFIATTTFADFFERADFNGNRIFNVAGNWTEMQCSSGINHGLHDDQQVVQTFIQAAKNHDLSAELVPKCEVCQQPLELHLPLNNHFYPESDANSRFRWFLTGNEDKKVTVLELGVDEASSQLFTPLVSLVEQFPQWSYVAADFSQDELPEVIQDRSAAVNADSATLIKSLAEK
ncbi:Sir2 family NAD-dependent protein deacetylase [Lactobacillus sp. ESL0681]|uniref:Sir2 family NAD-dependent protein deacetylase n=1 Tax=Lactobacillus sp. ESL0681 TaxID=2983211 RepID=UPI0023F7E28C|nr:Sir2 family NAD-dependent protein deacetylase [Lactobacillus sp. ESL0681]WEV41194.1 Sir2 family NAD-dependent protein deacetylase [Lactobacillus sp. ESL0681]